MVGFQDLGAKDDFTTRKLEVLLIKKGTVSVCQFSVSFHLLLSGQFFNCHLTGIIAEKKDVDEEDQEYDESKRRSVRSSAATDSDSE